MPISNPPSALVTRVVDILAAAGLKPLIFDADQPRGACAEPPLSRESERTAGVPGRTSRLRKPRG